MTSKHAPAREPAFRKIHFRELREECAAIDRRAEFVGLPSKSTLEARILLKIDAYAAWRKRHRIKSGMLRTGNINRAVVLGYIGHAGVKRTSAIVAALEALNKDVRIPGALRNSPEKQIDRDLDRYERIVIDREYGPPRDARRPKRISRAGSAREIGCSPDDIDEIAIRRLTKMAIDHGFGELETEEDDDQSGRRAVNPAVALLLEEALDKLADAMPADPLVPTAPDIITVCDVAGIGVPDVLGIPDLKARIMTAAANSATLVPHPLVVARRYTYADLIRWARDEERERGNAEDPDYEMEFDPEPADRKDVHALRDFLRIPGKNRAEGDTVPHDFKQLIEAAAITHSANFAPGWRGRLGKWIRWNEALRATMPVPEGFAVTLRILCSEIGVTPAELDRRLGTEKMKISTITTWATGGSTPSAKSEDLVIALAAQLRVPVALLKRNLPEVWRRRYLARTIASEFPGVSAHLPLDFDEIEDEAEKRDLAESIYWSKVRQGTPFGHRQALMSNDLFSLPEAEWGPEMQAAWQSLIPAPAPATGVELRSFDDDVPSRDANGKLKANKKSWRAATIEMRVKQLQYLFGYFARPREMDGEEDVPQGQRPLDENGQPIFFREGGIGMPRDLIKPGILALVNLPTMFAYWRVRRSGRYVNTITATFRTVANMLRPEVGIIWRSPEMIAHLEAFKEWWDADPLTTRDGTPTFDIDPFRQDWYAAVTRAFDILSAEIEKAGKADLEPTRDSFLPVNVFTEHARPMEHYMVGLRSMLRARPQTIVSKHVHDRTCICALILAQTGLRAFNMVFTFDDGDPPKKRRLGRDGKVLPPTLRRTEQDGVVKWKITIPASEFKNWYSPYFKGKRPYEFELRDDDDLYALLDRYVTKGRRYLLKGRKSDAFFITSTGGDMSETDLSDKYRIAMGRHVVRNPATGTGAIEGAMMHGMHAVRNIIATHIVKVTGDIYLAAWAIQDSPKTVEKHYARFIPKDKAEHAARILDAARAGTEPTLYLARAA